jgi:hypothetical protein
VPLTRRFTTANAIENPKVPWYEPTVAYLILIPTGLLIIFAGIVFVDYFSCGRDGRSQCGGATLLESTTGSYTGIVWSVGLLLLLSVLCAAIVQFRMGRWHFLIIWSLAALALGSAVLAYLIISGAVGTPWGSLIPDV